MKHIVQYALMLIIAVTIIVSIVSIENTNGRKTELDTNISTCAENAFDSLYKLSSYDSLSDEQKIETLENEFEKELKDSMNSVSNVEVQYNYVNVEKGILDVKVEVTYKSSLGVDDKIERTKMVIYEKSKTIEEKPSETHTVTFYLDDGSVYKTKRVSEKDNLTLPEDPKEEGKTFDGWKDSAGNIINENTIITEDVNCYVIFD